MSDIECPYCEKELDICHDDGAGYTEDETHEQQCEHCDKYFVFTTSTIYHYYPEKADCLNGSNHSMKEVTYFPKSLTHNWQRCETCGFEKREAL